MILIEFITKASSLIGKFVVFSSSNPDQISRTLTSLVPMVIPALMFWTGLDQHTIGEAMSDAITAVSLLLSGFFLIVKVVRTLSGNNEALK